MPSSCCCYTTDYGYLFPTLLSAKQMRDNVPNFIADVQVIYFGSHNDVVHAADIFCKKNNIKFINVSLSILESNPMLCARFFISKIIDKNYKNILYVDGDTQIAGSIVQLLNFEISEGTILAARDPMSLKINSSSREWSKRREYFHSIGINNAGQENYFNSGIVGFRATDWESISKECLILYQKNKDRFLFADQDTLNIVAGSRCAHISMKWNFPGFLIKYGAEEIINPKIYHFMSNPRPWHGPFRPWGNKWYDNYARFAEQEPDIKNSLLRLSAFKRLKYRAQQRYKGYTESRSWGMKKIGNALLTAEAKVVI